MSDFRPLPPESQADGTVLFFKANARQVELFEAAEHRLSTARNLLESLASVQRHADDRAMPAVAAAAALLLSDATGLLHAMYPAASRADAARPITPGA